MQQIPLTSRGRRAIHCVGGACHGHASGAGKPACRHKTYEGNRPSQGSAYIVKPELHYFEFTKDATSRWQQVLARHGMVFAEKSRRRVSSPLLLDSLGSSEPLDLITGDLHVGSEVVSAELVVYEDRLRLCVHLPKPETGVLGGRALGDALRDAFVGPCQQDTEEGGP